ncbi:MAG: M23 family metallopeptidase [Pseudomonadota bacterium]|nr:M23 family metallopeptidase [Pseudomonadota bacterium]
MIAAISGLSVATPAFANSAAANADVTSPLRAAQAAKPSAQGGDDDFRKLFNGWKSMDNGQLVLTPATKVASAPSALTYRPASVSIPSRMPVSGAALTSGFGMRWHPVIGGRRAHKGVDLAEPVGSPVYATADGMVSRADWFSSYGLFISLEHGGNIQTRYGHLSRLNVAAGQTVHKGDLIGYVGTTGRSTGPHLHYEVRIAGVAVNPIPYLQGGIQTAVAPAATQVALGGGEDDGE